ncbi:MAG: corrinoid protein [Clostridiales Family XIII bacterium]|jgi:5-methyltetrahydrofolate--homocysteine methyltransferase|nr:corrinoid protein [Clostridiales Family XIII bacterium]
MAVFEELSDAVHDGNADLVESLIGQAFEEDIPAQDILDKGLLDGMNKLGVKFKNNEVFVPEVLIAARALNRGTTLLKAKLVEEGVKPLGKVVIATVAGDLHDIGKNLVKLMLEGAGFAVVDLGVDVSPEKIVDAVKEHEPDILALSALLTTTMAQQGNVLQALRDAGLRNDVKVLVGGAPVTEDFADKIGADGYTADAASAAEAAKSFMQEAV